MSCSATVYYLRSYETYALWEHTPMQGNDLYEIHIPEYLLDGYYNIAGLGFLRLVNSDHYNEDTDYNVQLLEPADDMYKQKIAP